MTLIMRLSWQMGMPHEILVDLFKNRPSPHLDLVDPRSRRRGVHPVAPLDLTRAPLYAWLRSRCEP